MLQEASRDTKRASRCIGIDDGPFPPTAHDKPSYAPLIAVWLKGPHLQRTRSTWITVDGLDATRKAQHFLRGSTKIPTLLSGVTFGGFNLIDPWKIQKISKAPTLVVVGYRPDNRAVKRALARHFSDWKERWDLVKSLGSLHKIRTIPGESPIFFERFGCSTSEAQLILRSWALVTRIPEPIRVAAILARGLFPRRTS